MREAIVVGICAYPTRGLWRNVDHSTNNDRGDHGTPEHQPPSDIVLNSAKRDGHNIAKCDAKCGPYLPLHDQGATNRGGGAFCSIDGGSCGFRADPKTKKETSNEELGPRIGKSFPYRGEAGDDARPKDAPTTTNKSVYRISEPAR